MPNLPLLIDSQMVKKYVQWTTMVFKWIIIKESGYSKEMYEISCSNLPIGKNLKGLIIFQYIQKCKLYIVSGILQCYDVIYGLNDMYAF